MTLSDTSRVEIADGIALRLVKERGFNLIYSGELSIYGWGGGLPAGRHPVTLDGKTHDDISTYTPEDNQ